MDNFKKIRERESIEMIKKLEEHESVDSLNKINTDLYASIRPDFLVDVSLKKGGSLILAGYVSGG